MTPKDLIDRWEKTARRYEDSIADQTNNYTVERLYAQADTLKLCASDLRRLTNQLRRNLLCPDCAKAFHVK